MGGQIGVKQKRTKQSKVLKIHFIINIVMHITTVTIALKSHTCFALYNGFSLISFYRYVQEYRVREGVELTNVEKNPGMRALAKLMLNRYIIFSNIVY